MHKSFPRRTLVPVVALSLATFLDAQAKPGESVAAVVVTPTAPAVSTGEMYIVNHETNTATKLTLPAALVNERTNCVTMMGGPLGFVGTNPIQPAAPPFVPGNIYQITIAGTVVTATQLNTTPAAGPNVAQIALVGGKLYFVSQNASNTGGVLQSVSMGGGPVTTEVDLATVSGAVGLGNALCAIGTKVYVACFDSGATATTGSVVVYDTTTSTASVLTQLPKGKYVSGTSTFNTGIVHAQAPASMPGKLLLIGVYGDVLVMDAANGNVLQHTFSGAIGATSTTVNLLNSGDWDPITEDVIVGSRDGWVERIVSGHAAEKIVPGVGSSATASQNSVVGLAHIPANAGADVTSGAGCPGFGGYTLTDVGRGVPVAGNGAFQMACYSGDGGNNAVLVIGVTNPGLDLSVIGMTNCILRSSLDVTIPTVLTGTGAGLGKATIPFPIPAGVSGTIFRQWVQVQAPGRTTNPLGLVLSNGRKTAL